MTNYTYEYNECKGKQFKMFCFLLTRAYCNNNLAAIATQQSIQRLVFDIQSQQQIHTNKDTSFTLTLKHHKKSDTYTIDRSTWALYLNAAEKSAQKQKPALRAMYVAAVFSCLAGITLATLAPGSNAVISVFSTTPSFEPTVIVLFAVLGAALLTLLCAGIAFEAVKWNKENRRLFADFKHAFATYNNSNASNA